MIEKNTGKDNIVFCLVGKEDALQPEARSSSSSSRTKMWDRVMTGPSSTASGTKPTSKVTHTATVPASVVVVPASACQDASVVAKPSSSSSSSSNTKSKIGKASKTGITIIKEGGIVPPTGGLDSQAPAVSMVKSIKLSTTRVPASVVSASTVGVPAPEINSTLKADRTPAKSMIKSTAPVSITKKSKSGGAGPAGPTLSGGEHVAATTKPKPTMTEKLMKTKEQAQKVCKTVIESKILVSIMVFLCTMLLLICLNPPMAQEQDSTTKQRSWKKIMVWSSLAMVLALLLPYTCKPVGTN